MTYSAASFPIFIVSDIQLLTLPNDQIKVVDGKYLVFRFCHLSSICQYEKNSDDQ